MTHHHIAALLAVAKLWLGPVYFVGVLAIVFVYWQTPGDGPLWKDVAFGCISIIGVLATLGYASFVRRMGRFEKALIASTDASKQALKESNAERQKQHTVNQRALAAIIDALRTGKTDHLSTVDLFGG